MTNSSPDLAHAFPCNALALFAGSGRYIHRQDLQCKMALLWVGQGLAPGAHNPGGQAHSLPSHTPPAWCRAL